MIIIEYKNFVRKLATELRGKSAEEIRVKLEQLTQDVKREITYGANLKK